MGRLVTADMEIIRTEKTATAGRWAIITVTRVSTVFLILGVLLSIEDYDDTIGASAGLDTVSTYIIMVCRNVHTGAS